MSEATTQRLKVSREGMILIKSFEGFRPRAVAGEDGGWVIGYGHTLSAREGASVSEADAELLLQYDLLPVVKMLNEQAPGLNQHQFDALASFAFSIGADRFLASDVARRVSSGALGEAADALIGWPEPPAPEAALRRRAAERALFVADPSHAVTLADLLAAPLPPPEVVTPVFETPSPVAARAAAVATLLGEAVVEPLVEAGPPEDAAPETDSSPDAGAEAEAEVSAEAPLPTAQPLPSAAVTASFQFQRFSPYAAAVVGPLPGLGQAASIPTGSFPPSLAVAPEAVVEAEPVVEPAPVEPERPEAPELVALDPAPAEPTPEAVEDPFPSLSPAAAVEPIAPTGPLPTAAVDAEPPALVLTPLTDAEAQAVQRPVWGEQQREPSAVAGQEALFEEEPAEVSVLRHEEIVEPRRFDSAQAAFMIMGGVGLASCTASAAAFRQALEDSSGLNDYTLLGWTLGVIGVVCVVASAANLYPRLFPPKDK